MTKRKAGDRAYRFCWTDESELQPVYGERLRVPKRTTAEQDGSVRRWRKEQAAKDDER